MPDYDELSDYDLDEDIPAPQADADPPSTSAEGGEPTEQAAFSEASSANALADGPLPPWHIPGTDWKVGPTWSGSTDDSRDTPQNKDRAEQRREDERRGQGDPTPPKWWSPKPLDLSVPQNDFTPEAQAEIKRKQAERDRQRELEQQQERQRRLQEREQLLGPPPPDERGDYPIPPDDPRYS